MNCQIQNVGSLPYHLETQQQEDTMILPINASYLKQQSENRITDQLTISEPIKQSTK